MTEKNDDQIIKIQGQQKLLQWLDTETIKMMNNNMNFTVMKLIKIIKNISWWNK